MGGKIVLIQEKLQMHTVLMARLLALRHVYVHAFIFTRVVCRKRSFDQISRSLKALLVLYILWYIGRPENTSCVWRKAPR